ncbi:terminase small subunit-like protein [Swingsia samuiensis]|uniref:Ubiquitin carboxyl-hydrolase n=1 Tax=Swingsia samuiensis TaxID=1293412 RepID=A0A4Y6UIH1_9PROT|nr:ubiquitin carboxyl-hydrolase [Swingsia samuiensis]QDH17419.1 ubiquitin carboxyl-hydrolase [Swingsia samuiensis]
MAKAVKKRASPVTITESLWVEILKLISEGETLRSISERDGMPVWETIRRYSQKDSYTIAQYAHARACAADAFEDRLLQEMNNPDPAIARVRCDTLKWIMARRAPKQYGDKITTEHTGANGAALASPTLILRMSQPNDQSNTD